MPRGQPSLPAGPGYSPAALRAQALRLREGARHYRNALGGLFTKAGRALWLALTLLMFATWVALAIFATIAIVWLATLLVMEATGNF